MTISEAIERIKTMAFMCDDFHNCKYGHDCTDGCSEAVKMAVDALQGSIKKYIGKDNMVISSADLIKILMNSDSEELKQYKEVGTVEECRVAVERMKPKKPIELDQWGEYWKCPTCEKYAVDNLGCKYKFCCECGTKFDWSE